MRSIAQKRFTAVGRVAASSSQTASNAAGGNPPAYGGAAQRDPHGRGHADGRRAADRHVADGRGHLVMVATAEVGLLGGQQALIDHHDRAILVSDRRDHAHLRQPFIVVQDPRTHEPGTVRASRSGADAPAGV